MSKYEKFVDEFNRIDTVEDLQAACDSLLEACKRKDELLEEIGETATGLVETMESGEPEQCEHCDYCCACDMAYIHWLKEAAKKIKAELNREEI